jgi:hypothetical protein
MSTPAYGPEFMERSSQRAPVAQENRCATSPARATTIARATLPPEIWDMILGIFFDGTAVYRVRRQHGSPFYRSHYAPASPTNTNSALRALSQVSWAVRHSAFHIFFSRNHFIFGREWYTGITGGFRVSNAGLETGAEYLRSVTVMIRLRPDGSVRLSTHSLIRLIGRSRYLECISLQINTVSLSLTIVNQFRSLPVFRILAQFRNIQRLHITFSTPWPGAEQWLRERMTTNNVRGEAGRHQMPAMWGSTLPSPDTSETRSTHDHDRWALALDIDWQDPTHRQIRRLVRAFVRQENRTRNRLNNPTASAVPQQPTFQSRCIRPFRPQVGSASNDPAVFWMAHHERRRPYSNVGDGNSLNAAPASHTVTQSSTNHELEDESEDVSRSKTAKLDRAKDTDM